MNKVQIILIVLFVILAVVGVFLFAGIGAPKGPEFTKASQLTLWGTTPASSLQTVLRDFKDTYKTEIIYVEKSPLTFNQELVDALAAQNGPDMIIASTEWTLQNRNKIITPDLATINPKDFQITYADIASDVFLKTELAKDNRTPETHILALPLWIDPIVLYWNIDIFNDASVALPPTNWDEFLAISNQLKKLNSGDIVFRAGAALGRAKNIPLYKEILSLLLIQQNIDLEQQFLGKDTALDTSGGPVGSARFYTDFGRVGTNAYTWNTVLPEPRRLFIDGKLGMMFDYLSYAPKIQEKGPHIHFRISLTPQFKDSTAKKYIADVTGIVVLKGSKSIADSWFFAKWLTDKNQVQRILTSMNVAPARRDLLSSADIDSVVRTSSLNARHPQETHSKLSSSILSILVETIASGQQSPSDALTEARARFNEALRQEQ